MKLLNGISSPAGEGIILEVHLDILTTDELFESWLKSLGFESDPFKDFHPSMYVSHMTGRTRSLSKDLHKVLPGINALVQGVIAEAQAEGLDLYAETELVRQTEHFQRHQSPKIDRVLDEMSFCPSGLHGGAKADIHVEFEAGTVPAAVREYLLSKRFYWVSTPVTPNFPAEDIATLQTTQYRDAKRIFDLLVASPLPWCTGIHLEQKLLMEATSPSIPMPEIIEVQW